MVNLCSTGYSQHMQPLANLGGASGATSTSHLLSRADWGARVPKEVNYFEGPAPYVIIHHSYIPAACVTTPECMRSMREMQDFHQVDRGWNDIGYSFGIGGDGLIYTGRGFNVVGAHAPKYNDKSVGIVLIGDWRSESKYYFTKIPESLLIYCYLSLSLRQLNCHRLTCCRLHRI